MKLYKADRLLPCIAILVGLAGWVSSQQSADLYLSIVKTMIVVALGAEALYYTAKWSRYRSEQQNASELRGLLEP